MAFVQQNQDDEEQLGGQQPQQGAEKVLTESTNPGDNAQNAPQGGEGAKPRGTGWVNLVNYVNANKDQGQQIAKSVAGGVQAKVDKANQAATAFEPAAQQQIDAGVQTVYNTPPPVKRPPKNSGSPGTGGVGRSPTGTTAYNGPTSIEAVQGYGNASQAVADASKDAQGLGSQEGIQGVLKGQYGRPNYTAGEQRLDSFLVGAAGAPEINQAQQNAAAAQTGWDSLVDRVRGNVADVQDEKKRNAKYPGKVKA